MLLSIPCICSPTSQQRPLSTHSRTKPKTTVAATAPGKHVELGGEGDNVAGAACDGADLIPEQGLDDAWEFRIFVRPVSKCALAHTGSG